MRKWMVASVFVLALAIVTTSWATGHQGAKVLDFKTMVGVVPPYVGSPTNAALTRGIQGAGAAWQIDRAKGKLRSNGDLEVEVKGLVLVSTGQNPLATFKAIVSCLSIDGNGQAVTVNQLTDAFPATMPGGDAEFDGSVSLPSPCIAPLVFVTTAGTTPRWIALTGT
ncbi:MAG TPA: hypothetical protein VK488_11595 [Gaiellaceae bacterium]|nr:hypothetical protein [Gaiellaceae bacterium]